MHSLGGLASLTGRLAGLAGGLAGLAGLENHGDSMNMYQMTEEDLTLFANNVKSSVLSAQVETDLITADEANHWDESTAVVVAKKGTLGRMWNRLFKGKEEDNVKVAVVMSVDRARYIKPT